MTDWIKYDLFPDSGKPDFPHKACVYAVYFDKTLVYVGQTNRLKNRFAEHNFRHGYGSEKITPWGNVPFATSITLKVKFSKRYGDWAMWEIRLINKLQPRFNRHHKQKRC